MRKKSNRGGEGEGLSKNISYLPPKTVNMSSNSRNSHIDKQMTCGSPVVRTSSSQFYHIQWTIHSQKQLCARSAHKCIFLLHKAARKGCFEIEN